MIGFVTELGVPGYHRLFLSDSDTGERRFVATFNCEEAMDYIISLALDRYKTREDLWARCKDVKVLPPIPR